MKPPLRVGLDLDGVFANFNDAFLHELMLLSSHDRRTDRNWPPRVWNWIADLGYTGKDVEQAWRAVDRNPLWWATLAPYEGAAAALAALGYGVGMRSFEITFLTSRHSPTAHAQSVEWLQQFLPTRVAPQVCICKSAESKGLMAQALDLDVVVDDHDLNLLAIQRLAPGTKTLLFDRPWNRSAGEVRDLVTAVVADYNALLTFIDQAASERRHVAAR